MCALGVCALRALIYNEFYIQIGSLVAEGSSFGSTPAPSVSINLKPDDFNKKSASLVDDTKKLSNLTVCHLYAYDYVQ